MYDPLNEQGLITMVKTLDDLNSQPTTIDPPSELLTGLITVQLKRKQKVLRFRLNDIKAKIKRDNAYEYYWNQSKDHLERLGFTILHQLFLPEKFGGHVVFVVQYQSGMEL